MNFKALIALIAAVVLGVVIIIFALDSDEDRVRHVFEEISERIQKTGTESTFIAAGKAKSLSDLVAPKLTVAIPDLHVETSATREQIAQAVVYMRGSETTIDVTFDDFEIDINESADGASVRCRAMVSAKPRNFGFPAGSERRVAAELKKDGGDWSFVRIEVR